MSLKKYITKRKVSHFNKGGIHVFVKDPLPTGINAESVIQDLIESVPKHLLKNIETIYIGKFKELEDRDIQAMYDLIHETGHSVEEIYRKLLYSDQKLESEFLRKRKDLWHELKRESLETSLSFFLEPDYDKDFDEYLYKQIGYPMLSVLTANLFYSPYASTSLREYFANGFEAFFMRDDVDRLKNLSPVLFSKLATLLNDKEQ